MRKGKLRQKTRLYLTSGFSIVIPKGTEVHLHDHYKLVFKLEQGHYLRGVTITLEDGIYKTNLWGRTHHVEFPKGGNVPYPLSIL